MAKVVYHNGVVEDVEPCNGDTFELRQLQIIVGGYIEIIRSLKEDDDRVMVVDEEGKMKNKFYNRKATNLLHEFGYMEDFVAGTALVCRSWQIN